MSECFDNTIRIAIICKMKIIKSLANLGNKAYKIMRKSLEQTRSEHFFYHLMHCSNNFQMRNREKIPTKFNIRKICAKLIRFKKNLKGCYNKKITNFETNPLNRQYRKCLIIILK